GHLARKDDRNSLGGFHHGSGAIAPIKNGYMAAIPERYFQEKTLGLLGASIYGKDNTPPHPHRSTKSKNHRQRPGSP
ncbi:TPA: hypothetical protein ACGBIE_003371, partial [Yersinia enterocolitica]